MSDRISSIENQLNAIQVHLALADNNIQESTTEFRHQIELKFASESQSIHEIVVQAQQEFGQIRTDVNQTKAGIDLLFSETR